MIDTKSILYSKTMWFNLIAFLIWLTDTMGQFPELFPENFYKWFALIVLIGNKLLRLNTSTKVVLKKDE